MKLTKLNLKMYTCFFLIAMLFSNCSSKDDETPDLVDIPGGEPPIVLVPIDDIPGTGNVGVTSLEDGAAIYLDGVYTGKNTPSRIEVSAGDHLIGVGLNTAIKYLRTPIVVTEEEEMVVSLNETHHKKAKKWKVLFLGIKKAVMPNGSCSSEYTEAELDVGFDFLKWQFQNFVEPDSYNTISWDFDKRYISNLTLSGGNSGPLATPDVISPHITDVNPGDYDLILSFFNRKDADCNLGEYKGIGWYAPQLGDLKVSYVTIRYNGNIEESIKDQKENDPGVFIREWLHTVIEQRSYFTDLGTNVPSGGVHSAENHEGDYSYPWMNWYQNILAGKVIEGDTYVGIGPDAFLECTVKYKALNNCL
ncbi:PEGA domain-containing protein [Tenacibaculum pacificus]|uniref:PEGA domain-containing protein n=1 Tax=Tenacibaculum pacificus TaxID=3018314 RepID=UPI0022F3CEB9|nr:PEGA domain-containing protein [Tenacibaculum pacificus]WBX74608.1 PEGA domain-containing protein [Tenacibaculum pacificus]